tara:strand:+ start:665 stop:1198 length:534 start_codon:yes stop_codon:yes gene_type:complete
MIHNFNIYYFIEQLNKKEIIKLNSKVNIIYRNYKKKPDFKELWEIKKLCIKTKRKFFIAENIKIALRLNVDGIYIPSFNKSFETKYINKKKLEVLGSAHNFKELSFKIRQDIDKIFISPIFEIKKKNSFLNVIKFNLLSKFSSVDTIALGGINKKNINKLKMVNCVGFAAIRYFKNE